jgi:hypothetical protein
MCRESRRGERTEANRRRLCEALTMLTAMTPYFALAGGLATLLAVWINIVVTGRGRERIARETN